MPPACVEDIGAVWKRRPCGQSSARAAPLSAQAHSYISKCK